MENQNSFTPLYSDLKEKLEDDILDRGLQGGVFLGTFHEICSKYAVSITTARKAVDCLVKPGILKCRPSQGIFTADVKKLSDSKSLKNFILILHNHPEGGMAPYFSLRLCAMLQIFSEYGMTAKVVSRNTDPSIYLNSAAASLKGIVTSPSILTEEQLLYYSQKIPVLLFNRPLYRNIRGIHVLNYDNKEVCKLASQYFRSKKFKDFVMIHHDENEIEQYSDILKGMNINNFSVMRVKSPSVKCGREITSELSSLSSSTGCWAMDDFIAVGIVEGFLKKGKDIRENGRLLAFGNPRQAFIRELGIPVVGWDPWSLGQKAAQFLCDIIKDGKPADVFDIEIQPEIVI